jgi:hypothetical protein
VVVAPFANTIASGVGIIGGALLGVVAGVDPVLAALLGIGAALIVLPSLVAAYRGIKRWRLRGHALRILRAVWGATNTWDVTQEVRAKIRDGSWLLFVANRHELGDPARGEKKTLTIEYQVDNGPVQSGVYGDGQRVILP